MKKLLLLLLIVGCEETGLNTESLTDGTSVTDTLYVVNYDTTFVYDTLVVTNNDTIYISNEIHGCLDSQATNYDTSASINNNSCTYIDSCGVIDVDKTNDCEIDCNGVWGGGSVIIDSQCINCESDCIYNYMVISQNYQNVCTEADWAVWFFTYDYKIKYFEFELDNASIIELHNCGGPAYNAWTVNVEDSKIIGESEYIYNLNQGLLIGLDLDGEPSKLKNIKVIDESGVVREITYCSDDMNCLGWDGSTYMFTP